MAMRETRSKNLEKEVETRRKRSNWALIPMLVILTFSLATENHLGIIMIEQLEFQRIES